MNGKEDMNKQIKSLILVSALLIIFGSADIKAETGSMGYIGPTSTTSSQSTPSTSSNSSVSSSTVRSPNYMVIIAMSIA